MTAREALDAVEKAGFAAAVADAVKAAPALTHPQRQLIASMASARLRSGAA